MMARVTGVLVVLGGLILAGCAPSIPAAPTASPTLVPARTPSPSSSETPPAPPTVSARSREAVVALLEDDPTVPLAVTELGVEEREGIAIRDLTFGAPGRPQVPAFLVTPPGEGPFAGVLFLHWYAPQEPTGDRTEFLEEAVALATRGTVSLLVEGLVPWLERPDPAEPGRDQTLVARQVVELRRALDLLLAQTGVDPERVAVVGHDFGAMYAATLASTDDRPVAYVLIAGTPHYGDWFLPYWSRVFGARLDAYTEEMAPLDPLTTVSEAAPASILFQFGRNDRFIPESAAEAFVAAAEEPKEVRWYEAGHALNDEARQERMVWLTTQLALETPP